MRFSDKGQIIYQGKPHEAKNTFNSQEALRWRNKQDNFETYKYKVWNKEYDIQLPVGDK